MEFSIRRTTRIAEWMAEELQEKLGSGAQIAEIEQAMRELAKEVSGLGMQKMIEEQEEKYACQVECECGRATQPLGKREAVVWSVFGKVEYRRRYYLCENCHGGQSSLDERLGLVPGQSTPGLAACWGSWEWKLPLKKPVNWRSVSCCFG